MLSMFVFETLHAYKSAQLWNVFLELAYEIFDKIERDEW